MSSMIVAYSCQQTLWSPKNVFSLSLASILEECIPHLNEGQPLQFFFCHWTSIIIALLFLETLLRPLLSALQYVQVSLSLKYKIQTTISLSGLSHMLSSCFGTNLNNLLSMNLASITTISLNTLLFGLSCYLQTNSLNGNILQFSYDLLSTMTSSLYSIFLTFSDTLFFSYFVSIYLLSFCNFVVLFSFITYDSLCFILTYWLSFTPH